MAAQFSAGFWLRLLPLLLLVQTAGLLARKHLCQVITAKLGSRQANRISHIKAIAGRPARRGEPSIQAPHGGIHHALLPALHAGHDVVASLAASADMQALQALFQGCWKLAIPPAAFLMRS
jgi:hypothetical protein